MKDKKRSAVSWIAEFAEDRKMYYALSVLTAALGVLCGIAPYFFIADIIKKLLAGTRVFGVFAADLVLIMLFWALRVVLHAVSTSLSHKATFRVLAEIRTRCCDKLARLPLGSVLDIPSGSLKNTLVERVDSIETTLAHVVPEFTGNLFGPLCVLIYLFFIDWRMALVSLISLPIGIIFGSCMWIGYEASWKRVIDKTKALNDTAVEYINGIEVIKVFGKVKSSYDRFVVAAKEGASCFIDWMRRANIFFTLTMVITPATLLFVLPAGGFFVKNGSLAASDFIQIIILSIGLITPLITAMSYTDDMAKVSVVIGEVSDILERKELSRPDKMTEEPEGNAIRLDGVRFAYREKEVLHGISLEIPDGSVCALVGPSGSGKSTIAKLIASLWDAGEGVITLGGVDIRKIPLEAYNRRIAFVSQDNYLFNESVRENIRMGKEGASDKEVEEAAKKSGCHEFIESLEHGYDTIVGDSGGHLSGGERQRIAIARAMLKDAPVVILDEATSYTDPENEAVIQSSVAKLVKGKTLLVIAHRLSTIKDSDKIFVIKDGKLDDEGTHRELLSRGGLYAKMWEAHISVKDGLSAVKG